MRGLPAQTADCRAEPNPHYMLIISGPSEHVQNLCGVCVKSIMHMMRLTCMVGCCAWDFLMTDEFSSKSHKSAAWAAWYVQHSMLGELASHEAAVVRLHAIITCICVLGKSCTAWYFVSGNWPASALCLRPLLLIVGLPCLDGVCLYACIMHCTVPHARLMHLLAAFDASGD